MLKQIVRPKISVLCKHMNEFKKGCQPGVIW